MVVGNDEDPTFEHTFRISDMLPANNDEESVVPGSLYAYVTAQG